VHGLVLSSFMTLADSVQWRWGPDTVDLSLVATAAGAGAATGTCLVVVRGFPDGSARWPAYGTLIGAALGSAAWLILGAVSGFHEPNPNSPHPAALPAAFVAHAIHWMRHAPAYLLCATVLLVGGIIAVASGAAAWIAYATTSLATVAAVLGADQVEERGGQRKGPKDIG
jgi:hypothetical protein